MREKLLNGFAGRGGNAELWDRSKYEVIHVENHPDRVRYLRETFPNDPVIEADAYEYILNNHDKGFSLVWASPPCKTHSRLATSMYHNPKMQIRRLPDFKLHALTQWLNQFCEVPFIVENTISFYDPPYEPIIISKHYIWSNFHIDPKKFKLKGIVEKQNEDQRDYMDPEIGLYLLQSALKPQPKITGFFE